MKQSYMLNFNVQLHTVNENKTLNEAVEEVFSTKKPVVDLSFFYTERNDIQKIKDIKETKVKLPNS